MLLLVCEVTGIKAPTVKIHIYDFFSREKKKSNPVTIELTFFLNK